MRVILLQNVVGVGRAGEVVDVSPGHARNFLIAKGAAQLATPEAEARLLVEKRAAARAAERELKETEKLAIKLQRTPIEIKAKSGPGGKLFGAVTGAMIAQALGAKGIKITKERVRLSHPLKEIGDYRVPIELPHGLEAEIEVAVVAE